MAKRLLAVTLALIITLSALATLGGCSMQAQQENFLTRGQWVALLAQTFGMDEYESAIPYFSDVGASDEIYPFVQSCSEWGLFYGASGAFGKDEYATKEFVALTAIIAADIDERFYSEESRGEAVQLAIDSGIIVANTAKKDGLEDKITPEQGISAANAAKALYLNREFKEYANVELNSEVIDLSGLDTALVSVTEQAVVFTGGLPQGLGIGDVFIAPATPEEPGGIARKVESIIYGSNGELIVQTVEPELEEIFAQLDFAAVAVPDPQNAILGEGVTMTGYTMAAGSPESGQLRATRLSSGGIPRAEYMSETPKGLSATFNVNITKGKVSISPEWESSLGKFKLDLEKIYSKAPNKDELGKLFEKSNNLYKGDYISVTNKFSGGYEITGELKIKDLYIVAECETTKLLGVPTGIKSIYIEANCGVESTLKIKGKLENELKIATVPIPVVAGITINIDVILYAELSGELAVKLTYSANSVVDYHKNRGVKKLDTSTSSLEAEANITIELGGALGANIKVLGIEFIDIKVKVGVELEAKASLEKIKTDVTGSDGTATSVEEHYFKASVDFYYPIVKLSIGNGKNLANKLGIKFSWTMVGKESGIAKATKIPIWSKEWLLWTDAQDIDAQGDDATDGADTAQGNPFDMMILNSMLITLNIGESRSILVDTLPEGVSLSDLTFTSEDTSVVTVDAKGVVTAVGEGDAQVVVASAHGHVQSCAVIVIGSGDSGISSDGFL